MTTINKIRRRLNVRRQGISSIELVAASVILITAMTFATTLSFRIHSVIKDTRHLRIATNELSNQLEHITLLELEQAATAVDTLTLSEDCLAVFQEPKLVGNIERDDLGHRVDLQLSWQTPNGRKPVRLSGWIMESREETKDE